MENTRINELEKIAAEVRKDIVRMVGLARSGLIELPLLISDVLVYLYWEEMLLLAGSPSRKDRDRFVFGAEDGVPALYAILARRGYYEREQLWHYMRLGAMLQALPDFRRIPGIDAPLVTSGTELAIASGLACSLRKEGLGSRVFCFLEEKDCLGKDFMLEAEMCAGYGLDNITLISVCKDKAGTDPGSYPESMGRLKTYGWDIFETDGNDFGSMEKVFSEADCGSGRPAAVYAKVSNGRGLSFAGDDAPKIKMSMETMERALEELEGKTNG
ncbi:MAG TPA: transketolase [Synergistaceae bacterium]|jgi:transketolase|nr:transketolase [Synergistaceae bacterium]NLL40702.1 transketolase [Synergistaceae bacterium]HPX03779.1 transketolase [Synergistaceae bacterium]HQA54705.1 transketolase [Synergistaceae bacterium]